MIITKYILNDHFIFYKFIIKLFWKDILKFHLYYISNGKFIVKNMCFNYSFI